MKKAIKTIIIISLIYAIAWFVMPTQMVKTLIWGIVLIPIVFIVNISEKKKNDKFDKNIIINNNIESILVDFLSKTMIGREDQIDKLIKSPIIWCGLIDEICKKNLIINNEKLDGYFISSKLDISNKKIKEKINIIFITNDRNIVANLNKSDKVFTKNINIHYSLDNNGIILFYVVLNDNIFYKYNGKSFLKYDNSKKIFEDVNDILEFNNIIFETNNFGAYNTISYFVKIYMDDKYLLKINGNSKETLLCEKGTYCFKAELEIYEETIKSNNLNICLYDKTVNMIIDLINENGKNKLSIKEK
jgi:hypothetical protein